MSKFTAFTSALLLTTTPSLLVYPQEPYVEITTTPEDQTRTARDYTSYNGKVLDKSGKVVDSAAPEAHIPIEEFVFKD